MPSKTTAEEIRALCESVRTELATSLKEAEARIKAGNGVDYDPKSFKDRLIALYRGVKHSGAQCPNA